MTEREHIDVMLGKRGYGDFDSLKEAKWLDVQPDFETAHFLKGFGHPDGKFRFKPQWVGRRRAQQAAAGTWASPSAPTTSCRNFPTMST